MTGHQEKEFVGLLSPINKTGPHANCSINIREWIWRK